MPFQRKSIKFCALGQKDESASCPDDGTEDGKERACDTLLLCLITTMNVYNAGGWRAMSEIWGALMKNGQNG